MHGRRGNGKHAFTCQLCSVLLEQVRNRLHNAALGVEEVGQLVVREAEGQAPHPVGHLRKVGHDEEPAQKLYVHMHDGLVQLDLPACT